MAKSNTSLRRDEHFWKNLKELKNVLLLPYTCTVRIQKEDLAFSDFFGEWIKLKSFLQDMDNDFSRELIRRLEQRELQLFNNEVFAAALYLDKRFQFLLQLQGKINHLKDLWRRIQEIKKKNNTIQSTSNELNQTQHSQSRLAAVLHSQASSKGFRIISKYEPSITNIENRINSFDEDITLFDSDCSPLEFWRIHAQTMPELYELSNIVYAVPPAQTSVERSFSNLSFILTPSRCNLSDETLEMILFIRSNRSWILEE